MCMISGKMFLFHTLVVNNDIQIYYQEEFVGAFAAANLGDVSPNTQGPICVNTGEIIDTIYYSTIMLLWYCHNGRGTLRKMYFTS